MCCLECCGRWILLPAGNQTRSSPSQRSLPATTRGQSGCKLTPTASEYQHGLSIPTLEQCMCSKVICSLLSLLPVIYSPAQCTAVVQCMFIFVLQNVTSWSFLGYSCIFKYVLQLLERKLKHVNNGHIFSPRSHAQFKVKSLSLKRTI